MSRLRFDDPPETYERARKVLAESFRSLREVLDGGWRWREQVRGTVNTVIDTGDLPVAIEVPGMKSAPLAVLLLRAIPQRSASGQVISGSGVLWEWRAGAVLVHGVTELDASTRYDVTLAVME